MYELPQLYRPLWSCTVASGGSSRILIGKWCGEGACASSVSSLNQDCCREFMQLLCSRFARRRVVICWLSDTLEGVCETLNKSLHHKLHCSCYMYSRYTGAIWTAGLGMTARTVNVQGTNSAEEA
jgi:hypothetical protein